MAASSVENYRHMQHSVMGQLGTGVVCRELVTGWE
jgi:hypothetical protein